METKSSRPWQGTVLAVFGIIGTVFAFLGALALLFMQSLIMGMMTSIPTETIDVTMNGSSIPAEVAIGGLGGLLAGLGIFAGLIVLGLGIFEIFIVRGLLKGKRWTVIVTLVFAIIGVISGLASINSESFPLFGLALNGFFVYCSVMCLKAPFYLKKA